MMAGRRPHIAAAQIGLLRQLCEAVGVSGDETEVRQIILHELQPVADSYKVDTLGNLLVTKRGRGARRRRVMLDAHMDEVGFMLVAEDGDGLYQFQIVGGIDPRNIVGKQVVVGKTHTPGVIGGPIANDYKPEERKQVVGVETLRVDLGPAGKANVGDRGTFAPNFRRTGPSVMSKALDNRLGVATLIELMKASPPNVDVLAAFTVQEEIGLRGAKVAALSFNPDLAIVVDATPSHDLPMQQEGENTFYNTRLGLGPAIYVADGSAIDDPRLVHYLMETAKKARIPFQIRQPGGGSTNAGPIQRASRGVPVVSVSVPHRYPHSAMSVARIQDWETTLGLLTTALRHMDNGIPRKSRLA